MVRTSKNTSAAPTPATPVIRCAIYTRKSTTENLDTDFNSLDAQREACEAYIKSQAQQGWTLVPTPYDDGGFSGGNIDRPAFQRLLADIEAGKIDQVVVYKIDRISRSLLDFARIIERFENASCTLVSITQQFDNSTSMGKLVQAILMSFSAFERDMISERTSDKMGAARRKGKWTGGHLPLGYTLGQEPRRLIIVPKEARLVQRTFSLYMETRSVLSTARQLNREGLKTKARQGKNPHQGKPWTKMAVHRTLTNSIYIGMMPYRGVPYPGEHEAIIEKDLFDEVQALLHSRCRVQGIERETNSEYFLTQVFFCGACGARMISATSRNRQGRTYRYYRCASLVRGTAPCTNRFHIPAQKIEGFIAERIAGMAKDKCLREAIKNRFQLRKALIQDRLVEERKALATRLDAIETEGKSLVGVLCKTPNAGGSFIGSRLGEVECELQKARTEIAAIDEKLNKLSLDTAALETMLGYLDGFEQVWEVLIPHEKKKLVGLLLERVTFNPKTEEVTISLHDLNERE